MTALESRPEDTRMGITLAVVLTMLLAMQTVSVDTVLPAIPRMADALGMSAGQGQLTVSVYILTFAVAQLVYGPLSDRFGRRPVILVTMGVYVAGSVVAGLAASFEMLMVGRFLQGLGAASGPTLARAVVRDVHGPARSSQALSYLMSAFGIIAVINPIVGGALTDHFGWPSVFVYCGAYGALIGLISLAYLRETLDPGNRAAIHPARIAGNFAAIAGDRRFVHIAAAASAYYGGMFVFLAGVPLSMVKILGMTSTVAGLYFGLAISGFVFGSFLAGFAAHRNPPGVIIAAGAIICSLAGGALLVAALAGSLTAMAIAVPAFFYMFGLGGALPPSMAAAVAPFPAMAGAASSLLGFLQMSLGAIMVAATGYFFDGTILPMAVLVTCLSTTGLVILALRRGA